jgi:hypothetical protein
MNELFKSVINFFENERVSLSKKITVPLLVIMALLCINDIYGITYYFSSGLEADYIVKIENAKRECASDSLVYRHFDDMMKEAMQRKTMFEKFYSLFNNASFSKEQNIASPILGGIVGKTLQPQNTFNSDKNQPFKYENIFPKWKGNQLFHTITSSLSLIILCIVLLISFPILLFSKEQNKLSVIVSVIFLLGVLASFIWLTQWLFGLVPIILERAYINYTIQFILNINCIIFLVKKTLKKQSDNPM